MGGLEVYDATNLIGEALKRAPSPDRQAVLDQVSRVSDFEGVTGPVAFESNGDRRDPQVTIWRVERGEIPVVEISVIAWAGASTPVESRARGQPP